MSTTDDTGGSKMKIKSTRIENFRALQDVAIQFDNVTTLIGPNGAGKSTVLRALDWFFNGKAGQLSDSDCSFEAADADIRVEVTFDDLTEKDRDALGKYVPSGADTFTAWKTRSSDGAEIFSANAKGLPDFYEIKAATNATAKRSLYSSLRETRPELDLPTATSAAAVDDAMIAWEASHLDQLSESPEALQSNFFGFNSGGKMSGLFDFVLVTADLRASEESLDGKASIIGRILERSVNRTAADEEIAEIVKDARTKQQKVYDEKFKSELKSMTTQLNEVVQSYAPGRAISVVPAEVELKAPKTTFEVSVLDGDTNTAVDRQGHGFQRTLLISALQLLAQSGAASADGVICLAIEEPELFQHPIQAQTFAKVLRSLAEDATKRIQVTYATHSPYFIEARHFDQVRRLTRSADPVPLVTVHAASIVEVKGKLAGVIKDAVVERQLDGIVANQLSVALFANRAFLVEGTTEAAVFYGIGDRQGLGSLEANGISIVAVSGKGSIPLAHAVLTSLGITTYALFDADTGFEARAKANGKSQDKIDEERQGHVASNRSVLKYFGLLEEDFPAPVVSAEVAIFEDHLETFLATDWPEWKAACRAVEASAGISLAKNQLAYRTATLEAGGKVPAMLNSILTKVKDGEQ
ncbi:ATP-dependent nuclease [Curtobacterium poinsettiae]|uniref:ATP-dependent nuclease n=1 Tax=Curtobacterium poinsettiae TaxID=159612 RepID=UPI00203228C3|nr:ATP-dependent endonuclease [Curtobacterium flaccumfaciens]